MNSTQNNFTSRPSNSSSILLRSMLSIVCPVLLSLGMCLYLVDGTYAGHVVAWSVAFTVQSFLLKSLTRNETVEGYPRWAYFSCILYQLVTMPILTYISFSTHNGLLRFDDWWFAAAARDDFWHQVLCASFAGAMLKDYWVYGSLNEWFFTVHHIISIFGCCFLMTTSTHVGLITITAVQAECASLFYNVKTLTPSTLTRIAHVAAMTASNGCGLFASVWLVYTAPSSAAKEKVFMVVIGILLTLVRCAGAMRSWNELMGKRRSMESPRTRARSNSAMAACMD